MSIFSKFIGIGSYLPEKILTNEDISKIVDTSDEWIFKRTGIKERRIASENENTSDLATKATLDLLKNYNIDKNSIDMIIVATSSAENIFPGVAHYVCKNLELNNNIPCFDIQVACSGFIYGLTIVDSFIKSGNFKRILLIGAEKMSSIVNWKDRNTCVLFGDGAAAVLSEAINQEDKSILDYKLYADCKQTEILTANKDGINMEGQIVFKTAITRLTEAILVILKKNNLSLDQIRAIVPHQANYRIIDAVAEKLNISTNKFILTLETQGNTSAASVPLALHQGIKDKRIKTGDLILLEAIGAGMSWGCCLMKI